jgi:hypothetical protein
VPLGQPGLLARPALSAHWVFPAPVVPQVLPAQRVPLALMVPRARLVPLALA